METIEVGVFDHDEIFRRGVAAVLAESEGMSAITVGDDWCLHPTLGVAVVGASSLPHQRGDIPLVACLGGEGHTAVADRSDVYAVLDRRALPPEHLVEAIRAASVGLRIRRTDDRCATLTAREIQVLELLASGAGTRDISSALGYSERTVKQVISDVSRSLMARTRAEAVAVAMRAGVI